MSKMRTVGRINQKGKESRVPFCLPKFASFRDIIERPLKNPSDQEGTRRQGFFLATLFIFLRQESQHKNTV
jgi:hypothetical protein